MFELTAAAADLLPVAASLGLILLTGFGSVMWKLGALKADFSYSKKELYSKINKVEENEEKLFEKIQKMEIMVEKLQTTISTIDDQHDMLISSVMEKVNKQ